MKKLIALIAVLGFTAQANAQAEISHSGSFRLQYTVNDNVGMVETGSTHDWEQRFRWGMDIKAGENVNAHVTLAHAAYWGSNSDQYPGEGYADADGENQENTLVVNEAYANWMISDEVMARIGRGSFTMADGTVVSANDWEQIMKAFDGAMVTYDHEIARISAFGVRGASLQVPPAAGNDNGAFTGLAFDFKSLPEWLKTAHLHYIMVKVDDAFAAGAEDSSRIGVTLGGDVAGVDYRATYAMNSGEQTAGGAIDVEGTMMDAEVGYRLPDVMNLRVSALYHMDSGDDNAADTENNTYRPFHYDRHNNAGLMDVLGWGNLTYMKAAVTVDPSEDTTVGLAYYMFSATEGDDATYGYAGQAAGAILAATPGADDDLGSEIDLWATKRYSNNFAITGWYAMFQAGDRFGAGSEDQSQIYLSGNYTF